MKFTDPVKLLIQGRPLSKDNQARGRSRAGCFFTRPQYRLYEQNVRMQAIQQFAGRSMLTGDLHAILTFYFKDQRTPDAFNAPKSVMDALQGIVYKNDKQIKHGESFIKYDQDERVEIEIHEL